MDEYIPEKKRDVLTYAVRVARAFLRPVLIAKEIIVYQLFFDDSLANICNL